MAFDLKDEEYPEEWTYDEDNKPTCTNFKKWDWGNDADGYNEPPPPTEPEDPNQLCMPFVMDEIVTTPNGLILHVEMDEQ